MTTTRRKALLLSAVFCSGFSAILYQTVWQRILGLFCGGDVVSSTLVLVAFFLGLGLGTLIISPLADRLSPAKAISVYGGVNLAIAAYGAFSKTLFYDILYRNAPKLMLGHSTEYAVAIGVLLLPTALMGVSLPLLARTSLSEFDHASAWLSRLNAWNILGSVAGVAVTAWVLAPYLGFVRTLWIGAAINLTATAVAFVSAKHWETTTPVTSAAGPETSGVPWIWCGLTFFTGIFSIGMEVLWIRLFKLYSRPDAYLVAHITALILLGYALGSLYGAKRARRFADFLSEYVAVQLLAVGYTVFSFVLLSYFHSYLKLFLEFPVMRSGIIPALLLLPVNFLLGFSFPISQNAVQRDPKLVGKNTGSLLASNIAGNVLGAGLTGLVLLDRFGTFATLRGFGWASAALALVIWLRERPALPARARLAFPLAGLLLVALLFPSNATLMRRAHGVFWPDAGFESFEDRTGIVATWKERSRHVTLDADMEGHLPFGTVHSVLGSLPVLLHPNPERVLDIGLGSGGTPYHSGANPLTKQIDVYEISTAEVPLLQRLAQTDLGAPLRQMLSDARYRIIAGDGRRHLALSPEKYDVIESDAQYPRRSFSGILFSREFYQQVRDHLNPGGIFCLWAPTPATLATLRAVFPHVQHLSGWQQLALASDRPLDGNFTLISERVRDPRVADYLRTGWLSPDKLLSDLSEMTISEREPASERAAWINTDMHPRDEFLSGKE